MQTIPRILFHGSSNATIKCLSAYKGSDRCPFGPALYLTADRMVAACYVGGTGAIYEVEISGNEHLTIALNLGLQNQTDKAKSAIQCLLEAANNPRLSETWDARSIIEAADFSLGRQGRNALLREKGIWLLHGELSGMEQSGMCDRGIQYAVINDAAIVDCKPLNPPHAP